MVCKRVKVAHSNRKPSMVRELARMELYLNKKIEEETELLKKHEEEIRAKAMETKNIPLFQCLLSRDIPDNLGVDELKEVQNLLRMKMKKMNEEMRAESTQSQTTVVAPTMVDDGAGNKGKEPVEGDDMQMEN